MDLFEKLKRKTGASVYETKTLDIYFLIDFNELGAYIEVVDKKQQSIEFNYRQYHGHIREILRNLESINDKQAYSIEWENQEEHVYLNAHDYLLWQLKYCDNVINRQGEKLHFEPKEVPLVLSITALNEGQFLQGDICLKNQGKEYFNVLPLTESYVMCENSIYVVQPIGNNLNSLTLFKTKFDLSDLQTYLSLFFSYFQNIEVDYQNYLLLEGEEKIKPKCALYFEKIDENEALYLRVSQLLPGFSAEFLEEYDVNKVALINEIEQVITLRPLEFENTQNMLQETKKLIQGKGKRKKTFYQEDSLFILPKETATSFIREGLPVLLSQYEVFGAEKLRSYKIVASQPKLSFQLGSGIDFLEGEVSLDIEGEQFALFDVLKQYQQQKYVKLSDGAQAILNDKYIKKLERLFKKQKGKKVKISFFDLPQIEELIEERVNHEAFEKSREVLEGFNGLSKKRLTKPKAVDAKLRSYQQQGVKWLNYLHQNNLGGCLADDMGLGKTLQTITLLSAIYPKQKAPSLIVMPRSLLFNWAKEIQKFNPLLTFYTYYGSNRDLQKAKKHNLIFTTYAILRNDIEQFKDEKFYYVILDESQNIKNIQSQTSKATMLLQAKHRLALSGTPIENNLTELYSLFRFLNPAMFGTLDDFNKYYTYPIQQDNDKEAAKELRQKIYPFVLRRLKKNVLKELPPKIEQVLYVEMSQEQKVFYEKRRQFYYEYVRAQIGQEGIQNAQFYILQALTELRQISSVPEAKSDGQIMSAKRELLIEQVLDASANGHKSLIFVNFLQAIESIGEELEKTGIDYVSMTGATRDRESLVERFQNDKKCKVFLMTLKTGGVGLNLTAADMVYIYDPWWNTAAESQAIDRTHRMGQDKKVFSYKLITRDSIEEKILQLQEQKKELFDNVISSDSASIKSLSEKDIEFILA